MQKDSVWRGERSSTNAEGRKDEGFIPDFLAVKKDPIDCRLRDQVL